MENTDKQANELINSTSPYLLQHAYNPVKWQEWNEKSLSQARTEDKPILLSIGYSSCHWCHVMEHESFENQEIAEVMNEHFVCIKLDREERPDIDQIYMEAVQIMGLQGGWPLNVFLTPQMKPFYGGTYFPPAKWINLLKGVAQAYKDEREKLLESAEGFASSLQTNEIEKYGLDQSQELSFSEDQLAAIQENLIQQFDHEYGGLNRHPKFPMPSIWSFLLESYKQNNNDSVGKHVHRTLKAIVRGGIYDQIRGGFSRYSVDKEWFAPHFEKMLYDNGQLLSLYAKAYTDQPDEDYEQAVKDTVSWLQAEMSDSKGGFYSALDADSEGIEGKFYTWTYEELRQHLDEDEFNLLTNAYNVVDSGNWEHGVNILHRNLDDTTLKASTLTSINAKLLEIRNKRVKPGLDDKIIASWNALTIVGLIDCHLSFNQKTYLDLAVKCAENLEQTLIEGALVYRSAKDGKRNIVGYLDDYASIIIAFTKLSASTADVRWLKKAKQLSEEMVSQFYDQADGFFYYTAKEAEQLIARKKELFDNVIPSANALAIHALYLVNRYYTQPDTEAIITKSIGAMQQLILRDVQFLSYWASLWLTTSLQQFEIICIGDQARKWALELKKVFVSDRFTIFGLEKDNVNIPLFENKNFIEDKTAVYICQNKSCLLPEFSLKSSITRIESLIQ